MVEIIKIYWLPTLIAAAIAYLMGSISFAIPVTKLFIGKDIRTIGSGNAGFTNVLRCVGKPAAVITFLGDFCKGICALFLGEWIFHVMLSNVQNINDTARVGAAIAGLAALLGHLYPIYFGFKGGKGVLISAGIACALDYKCFVMLAALFVILFLITKTISICSITVAFLYPFATLIMNMLVYKNNVWPMLTFIAFIFGSVVIWMHRTNIQRIIAGTEPKTIAKSSKNAE